MKRLVKTILRNGTLAFLFYGVPMVLYFTDLEIKASRAISMIAAEMEGFF